MPFMTPQYIEESNWIELETSEGTYYLPASEVGTPSAWNYSRLEKGEGICFDNVATFYADFVPAGFDSILSIESIANLRFGARLSASGYMDCTEWSAFETMEAARQYIEDTYEVDADSGEDL